MVHFKNLIKRLNDHRVDFVVIGGIAVLLHGPPLATLDLDVCASMSDENVARIHAAMQGINPVFRMRPDRMRLWDDPTRLRGFKNIYL